MIFERSRLCDGEWDGMRITCALSMRRLLKMDHDISTNIAKYMITIGMVANGDCRDIWTETDA